MARESDIVAFYGGQIAIPPGPTNAVFVTPVNGEVASLIKNYPGGSMELLAAPPGLSISLNQFESLKVPSNGYTTVNGVSIPVAYLWAGASLVNLSGTGYAVSLSETVNISGPARFYLNNLSGATIVVQRLCGRSQGY